MNIEFLQRPAIELKNNKVVYDFYTDLEVPEFVTDFALGVMSAAVAPRVSFESSAEADIEAHLRDGGRLAFVAKHTDNLDPVVFGSMASRFKSFEHLKYNSVIPTKPSVPNTFGLRTMVDAVGSVPVWREVDVSSDGSDYAKSDKSLRQRAGVRFMQTVVHRIVKGDSLFIFPEGTRGGDPTTVGPLQSGINKIIKKAEAGLEKPVLIVPVGIRHSERKSRARKPSVHIGAVRELATADKKLFMANIKSGMQQALDEAIDRA